MGTIRAVFEYSPQLQVTSKLVQFTDRSSVEEDGVTIVGWEWRFGDGSPDVTEQNPEHVYRKGQEYTVHLRVTDSDGAQKVVSRTVRVRERLDITATPLSNHVRRRMVTVIEFEAGGRRTGRSARQSFDIQKKNYPELVARLKADIEDAGNDPPPVVQAIEAIRTWLENEVE